MMQNKLRLQTKITKMSEETKLSEETIETITSSPMYKACLAICKSMPPKVATEVVMDILEDHTSTIMGLVMIRKGPDVLLASAKVGAYINSLLHILEKATGLPFSIKMRERGKQEVQRLRDKGALVIELQGDSKKPLDEVDKALETIGIMGAPKTEA